MFSFSDILTPKYCWILDCVIVIYVWIGLLSREADQDQVAVLAKQLEDLFERPKCKIVIMKQDQETPEFLAKFDVLRDGKLISSRPSSMSFKPEQFNINDVVFPQNSKIKIPDFMQSETAHGILQIWTISSKGKWIPLKEDEHSLFCQEKSYVCLYISTETEKVEFRSVIYFWEGVHASAQHYIQYRYNFMDKLLAKLQDVHSSTPLQVTFDYRNKFNSQQLLDASCSEQRASRFSQDLWRENNSSSGDLP